MASKTSRLQQFHQALSRRYLVSHPGERPVLEILLYAVCLDGASHTSVEQAMDSLLKSFYDFNEVRVSSLRELSEQLRMLPQPQASASRIRSVLQKLFETTYLFDLEPLRKQDVGGLYAELGKYSGLSQFSLSYTVHILLRQNSVPVSALTGVLLRDLGLLTETEAESGQFPGVERHFTKATAGEFCSLLHQAGLEYASDPFGMEFRAMLLEIFPNAEATLPKPPESPPPESLVKPGRSKKGKPSKEKPVGKSPEEKQTEKNAEKKSPKEKVSERKGTERAVTAKETSGKKSSNRKTAAVRPSQDASPKKAASGKPSSGKPSGGKNVDDKGDGKAGGKSDGGKKSNSAEPETNSGGGKKSNMKKLDAKGDGDVRKKPH